MVTPFFSIILPTYNRADFLQKSIDSVINQSFTNWELLVIDDGSKDKTKEVVSEFNDDRIKYFYQLNSGVSAARNYGIEECTGAYICFLDDDDYFLEDHLSYLYSKILEEKFPPKLLCTHLYKKEPDKQSVPPIENYGETDSFNVLPWTPTVCIHNEILDKHQFNENLKIREDHELFDRIRREYGIITLKKCTVVINRHDKNVTNNTFKKRKGLEKTTLYYIKDRKEVNFEVLNTLHKCSIFLFIHYLKESNLLLSAKHFFKIILILPFIFYRKETIKLYKDLTNKIKTEIIGG